LGKRRDLHTEAIRRNMLGFVEHELEKKGRRSMKISITLIAGVALWATMSTSGALGQSAEPTFKGDPDVYKVIFEDANFRVIEATRKKGVHDKAHGHPLPSVVYNVTDCTTKQYGADGKTTDSVSKAGTANAVPVIASHSAENVGAADCKQIFVEKK
jgi:hypothetical protein